MSRVSVVMTVYNAMPFLPAAVESILGQTYTDFRFVIVNDGSNDGSREYLASLKDPRILLLDQENQGQQAAANRGIAASCSEYVARMDGDDVADLRRLELQVAHLDRHPEIGLVGGQIFRLGAQRSGLRSNFPTEHEPIVQALLRNHHSMCNATIMFRSKLFDELGCYCEHNIAGDRDVFLGVSEVSRLANLSEVLLSCRLHRGSINGRRIVEAQLFNEYAARLAVNRASSVPHVPFKEFLAEHRSQRWPNSWLFYLDCQSIGQYRESVAEIYNDQYLKGYARLFFSMLISPNRTWRRLRNMLSRD